MPPAALAPCLRDAAPDDWYALLNAHVFFWLDPARVERQSRACHGWPQVLLMFDGEGLLAVHAERAAVTPINTGNARRRPARRSRASLVPYARWRETGWESEAAARSGCAHVPDPIGRSSCWSRMLCRTQ